MKPEDLTNDQLLTELNGTIYDTETPFLLECPDIEVELRRRLTNESIVEDLQEIGAGILQLNNAFLSGKITLERITKLGLFIKILIEKYSTNRQEKNLKDVIIQLKCSSCNHPVHISTNKEYGCKYPECNCPRCTIVGDDILELLKHF